MHPHYSKSTAKNAHWALARVVTVSVRPLPKILLNTPPQ